MSCQGGVIFLHDSRCFQDGEDCVFLVRTVLEGAANYLTIKICKQYVIKYRSESSFPALRCPEWSFSLMVPAGLGYPVR